MREVERQDALRCERGMAVPLVPDRRPVHPHTFHSLVTTILSLPGLATRNLHDFDFDTSTVLCLTRKGALGFI